MSKVWKITDFDIDDALELNAALERWGDPDLLAKLEDMDRTKKYGKPVIGFITPDYGLMKGDAYTEVLVTARNGLLRKLYREELVGFGFPKGSNAIHGLIQVPAHIWKLGIVDFAGSKIDLENQRDQGFTNTIVCMPPESFPMNARDPISQATLRRSYLQYIDAKVAKGERSSIEDDWAAMKTEVGEGVTRQMVQGLRRQLAPEDWRKGGRPRKNPNLTRKT